MLYGIRQAKEQNSELLARINKLLELNKWSAKSSRIVSRPRAEKLVHQDIKLDLILLN